MVAEPDVELRVLEPDTQHRAARYCIVFICGAAETDECIRARLPERVAGDLPGTVAGHASFVRQCDFCTAARGRLCRQLADAQTARIALHVASDAATQPFIDLARGRQGIEHACRRDRTGHHRAVGQDQHALDLPLHLGRHVQRKVGADAGCRRGGQGQERDRQRRHEEAVCGSGQCCRVSGSVKRPEA